MQLIIKLENEQPVGHPMMLENFQACFPEIDVSNLPDNYKFFERVQKPLVNAYEIVADEPEYHLVGDIVKDVWQIRPMTDEEKQAKIDETLAGKPHDTWIFNEELCIWEPPVPYPDDGKDYTWRDDLNAWGEFIPPLELFVEAPAIPNELYLGKISQITNQV